MCLRESSYSDSDDDDSDGMPDDDDVDPDPPLFVDDVNPDPPLFVPFAGVNHDANAGENCEGIAIEAHEPVPVADEGEDEDQDVGPEPEPMEMANEDEDEDDDDKEAKRMDDRYGPRTSEYNLRPRRPSNYAHLHATMEYIVMTQHTLK